MNKSGLSQLARRTQAPPISWLMQLALDRPDLISLAAGFTDNETLPARETRRIMNQLLSARSTAEPALQYGSTPGHTGLRQLTSAHLMKLDQGALAANAKTESAPLDQTAFSPERLLITNGSQQLLYMVAEALCDPGDIVLVEDPTYFVFLGILQSHGLRCRGIRMCEDGLDVAHLEQVLEELRKRGELRRLKLFYSVTYFQNPTGITTALAKKKAALGLLRQFEADAGHPLYYLEDAAYRELRFSGADAPSALSLSRARERVIYAGTFGKPFATGIRAGYAVLPTALLPVVSFIKGNHDFGTASLTQHIVAEALKTGLYSRQVERLRQRYAFKAEILSSAMRAYFPSGVEWREATGGLYLWAKLPQGQKTGRRSRLFGEALANRVLYVPGELCYGEDPSREKPRGEMRLSFGNATEAAMVTGIQRLGAALGTLRRGTARHATDPREPHCHQRGQPIEGILVKG